VGLWAEANNVELGYVPTKASHLNRIECQVTALGYFTLDETDHRSHEEQNSMIAATSPGGTATPTTKHFVTLNARKCCLMGH
jgi:hypothetical protein